MLDRPITHLEQNQGALNERKVVMNLRVKFILSIVSLGLLCLMLPGYIWADTVNINSINANSSPFSVDISTTNLLAQYGITLANVTPGTTVFVACGECGGNSESGIVRSLAEKVVGIERASKINLLYAVTSVPSQSPVTMFTFTARTAAHQD